MPTPPWPTRPTSTVTRTGEPGTGPARPSGPTRMSQPTSSSQRSVHAPVVGSLLPQHSSSVPPSSHPGRRNGAERLIAAAEAKIDAGAADVALRLLDSARDQPLTDLQEALVGRLRARVGYALRRDRSAPRQLLEAAQALEPYDPALARDTYMLALSSAVYAGRLGEPGAVAEVASAILATTAADTSERASDLILRGQALLAAEGQEAALPTVRRAVRAFLEQPPDARELQWMWFGGRAAQDIWDAEGMRTLAERQVEAGPDSGNPHRAAHGAQPADGRADLRRRPGRRRGHL